jgi:peroxin-13
MLRRAFFLAIAALLAALSAPSDARAWGCYHAGYTHVGYGGVQHYGTTSFYGGGRYGGVSHYGYTGGGAYGGYHYGGTSAYRGGYGGYYGGYHYGGYGGGYSTGYYRAW